MTNCDFSVLRLVILVHVFREICIPQFRRFGTFFCDHVNCRSNEPLRSIVIEVCSLLRVVNLAKGSKKQALFGWKYMRRWVEKPLQMGLWIFYRLSHTVFHRRKLVECQPSECDVVWKDLSALGLSRASWTSVRRIWTAKLLHETRWWCCCVVLYHRHQSNYGILLRRPVE